MRIIEINRGSAAWRELAEAMASGHTYVVRIAEDDGVKVKVNGGMWSPPLDTGEPRSASARYICKRCGAESPAGIGYVLQPGREPEPTPGWDCPNPHKFQ